MQQKEKNNLLKEGRRRCKKRGGAHNTAGITKNILI